MPDVDTLDKKLIKQAGEIVQIMLSEIQDDERTLYWVVRWESQAETITDPDNWPPSQWGPSKKIISTEDKNEARTCFENQG